MATMQFFLAIIHSKFPNYVRLIWQSALFFLACNQNVINLIIMHCDFWQLDEINLAGSQEVGWQSNVINLLIMQSNVINLVIM
jgi:hypothetical protein